MSIGSMIALATERVITPIEGMHRAIAGRWFSAAEPIATPVRFLHDTISTVVYRSIRVAGVAAGMGLDAGLSVEPRTSATVQAIANGLWGDSLGRHADRLGITMGIRDRSGDEVDVDAGLAAAYPRATSRIVVLVHGLVETEACWSSPDPGGGLPAALDADPARTAVSVRYNSGLRVSANGAELASLLERLCGRWPVSVGSVALVGHSMGGLVIRAAIEAGTRAGHRWVDQVGDVVTLGTPHRGAPLEKLVNAIAWGLAARPETRPLAEFLNDRSVGIKDLRFGAIAEDDWLGIDPDALLVDSVGDHGLAEGIDHHFVAGVVTADPASRTGFVFGDLMVRVASGTGGDRLEPTDVAVFAGSHHFSLLTDRRVVDHIMGLLDDRRDT